MLNLFGKNAFARKRKAKVMQVDASSARVESLEDRIVLTTPVFVDDTFTITNDTGAAGLTAGDTVTWNGSTPVAGLTFGTNAFSDPAAGIAGFLVGATSPNTINIASGTYATPLTTAAASIDTVNVDSSTGAGQVNLGASALTLAATDFLNININGATAGTSYDQIVTSGAITLGATLNVSVSGFTPTAGAQYTIIDNTAGAVTPVVGTFAGLAEGAVISTNFGGSGLTARISYLGGNGLAGTGDNVVIIVDSVNSIVSLPAGAETAAYTVVVAGGMLQVNRTDVATQIYSQPVGSTQSITINGAANSEAMTISFAGGNPIPAGGLTFNGNANGATGDKLTLSGAALAASGSYTATAPGAGTITYSTVAGAINFTGLEPVVDNNPVTAYTINTTGAAETITIANSGATNILVSAAPALFESIDFSGKVSVTLNTGGGNDTIALTATNAAGLTGSFTVNGDAGADTLTVGAAGTLSGLTGTEALNVDTVNLGFALTAAAVKTGTATTVNVTAATAILQEAVSVSGPVATINAAGVAYAAAALTTAGKSITFAPMTAAAAPGVGVVSGVTTLTLDANDTYSVEATAAATVDRIVTTGAVTLGSAALTVAINYAAALNDVLTIIDGPGAAIVGTFAGLPEGGIVVSGSTRMRISYGVEVAGDVTLHVVQSAVNVRQSNGSLFVDGSGNADNFLVEFTGTNSVILRGNEALPGLITNFTGTGINGTFVGPFTVTGDLVINGGNGGDTITLIGLGGAATLTSGNVSIDLGSGADLLTTVDATGDALGAALVNTGLTFTGNVSVLGDTENDVVILGNATAGNTFTSADLSIDTGTGLGVQSISLGQATVNGNASLTNSGDLNQATTLVGGAAGNAISGNLLITQSSATNTGGYTVAVTNYSVGGRTSIVNGSSTTATGDAAVTLTSTLANVYTGTVSVANGSNDTNAITVVGGGFATQAGNVDLTNGVGAFSNTITVDGATIGTNAVNNRTTHTFTNGASPNNDINVGTVLTNTVNGQFFASNNSGAAGTNDITIPQGIFNRNVTLTNGLNTAAAAVNNVTVGTAGTGVDVTGNFVASNGNTGSSNTVTIGGAAVTATNGLRVTQVTPANGSGSGNVNITNGTTTAGNASVSITGADGSATVAGSTNAIDGNVTIRNAGSTAGGLKSITLTGLSTFGRTGVTLNNALGGNSTVQVGAAATNDGVFINGTGGLFVQDGGGISTLNLDLVTVGTLGTANQLGLRYQDLGGGNDTINIGNIAGGGSAVINGVTNLQTGAGSDAVTIGNTVGGSAAFNDSVFIGLGAGNDTLRIGAQAASPAFGSADKYQFDGGAGVDSVFGSQTSLSSWSTTNLNKKLKSKVTAFENSLASRVTP